MRRHRKAETLFMGIIMGVVLCTGCGKEVKEVNYGKGTRKIYVNLLKEYANFTNVAFYDYYNDRKVTSCNGKIYIEGSSYSSTELHISTEKGNTYWISTDKALNEFPSSFKLYTNYAKSTFDTYLKK